jgi:predicted transcriptional regulator
MKRTGQKMAVFPVDVRMKKNPIDSVLAEAEKSIEEEIFQSLEKLTIKDLKDRVNETITEEGFSYII